MSKIDKMSWYVRFAKATSRFCGRPPVFSVAVGVIVLWIITGPFFTLVIRGNWLSIRARQLSLF